MRTLTVRGWGALGALIVLAAVVVLSAVLVLGAKPARRSSEAFTPQLANAVARCNHLGEAAESDPACREAWRRTRAQFLGARTSGARP
jgi:conjugative transfer region protein TrbK